MDAASQQPMHSWYKMQVKLVISQAWNRLTPICPTIFASPGRAEKYQTSLICAKHEKRSAKALPISASVCFCLKPAKISSGARQTSLDHRPVGSWILVERWTPGRGLARQELFIYYSLPQKCFELTNESDLWHAQSLLEHYCVAGLFSMILCTRGGKLSSLLFTKVG